MRNRIAGIMHWDQVGIEHAPPARRTASKLDERKRRETNPYATIAAVTLLGVAIVLTLRALFGGPAGRA